MKLFKKLNQRGFSHHLIIPIIVVLVVGGIGAYILTRGHAEPLPTASGVTHNVVTTNSGDIGYSWDSPGIAENPNEGHSLTGGTYCYSPSGVTSSSFTCTGGSRTTSTAWRVDLHRWQPQHFDWYGPFSTVQVPSNGHGLKACFRIAPFYTGPNSNLKSWLAVVSSAVVSINKGQELPWSYVPSGGQVYPAGSSGGISYNLIWHDSAAVAAHGLPATDWCIYSPVGPGTYYNVEGRIKLNGVSSGGINGPYHAYVDLLHTTIGYY